MSNKGRTSGRGTGSGVLSVRLLCTSSLSALALLTLPSVAHAQDADRYWDANSTTPGAGGTGTWDTTALTWSTTGDGAGGLYDRPWDNTQLDNAIFNGTAGTVTVGVPITVHDITFNVSGYTLEGGTLTLAGATPTIDVLSGGTATINSILAGNAGLTKVGAGTLTLGGANSFSGGIALNAGTLRLGAASTFTGDVSIASGATLSVASDAALGNTANRILTTAGASLTIDNVLGASRVVLGGGGQTTIQGTGAAATRYSGAGGVTAYRTSLTNNANDYTGQARLQVSATEAIGFTSIGNLGEASALGAGTGANGTVVIERVDGATGTLSYTGTGSTSNRDWLITSPGGHLIFSNSGTGTLSLSGNIVMQPTAGTVAVFQAGGADLELLGQISGNRASVQFAGSSNARTITLGGSNSFNSPVSIVAVTVKAPVLADAGVNSSLGAGGGVTFDSVNGGVLSYTGAGASSNRTWTVAGGANGTISNDGTGALILSGGATLNNNSTLTLGGTYAGGVNTFSNTISGAGNLASRGAGTWVLTGANTRTGTIVVDGGTLRAGNASAFGTVTGVTVTSGTLDLNGHNLVAPTLTGSGGAIALGGANFTANFGTGVNNTYFGSITGAGSFTKLGGGNLTLAGVSTYTGATTIGGGALVLNFASTSGGPTTNLISDQSGLVMSGGQLIVTGAAGETNAQTFNGLTITGGNNTIRANGSAANLTVNLGAITRSAGLANFVLPGLGAITTSNADGALGGWATVNGTDYAKVLGGNIVAFTNADYRNKDDASTWGANEIISDAGLLANSPYFGTVGSSVQIGGLQYTANTGSTVNIAAGATLGIDGTIIVAPSVATGTQLITGGKITGTLGGGALGVQQNGTGTFQIASEIVDNTGTIGFTKAGTGTVVLSGSNSYTGATTVAQGTLSVNSIGDGGAVSAIGASTAEAANLVIQGATLEYTGGSRISNRGFTVTRSGAITAGTISVADATANLAFTGQVTSPDGAGLNKVGDGTLTLTNATSNYTGVTTISDGALAISSFGNGGGPSTLGASSSASANLVLEAGGELEYTGGDAVTNRGFTLGTGGGGAIDIATSGAMLTVSGVAAGAGALTKNGAGILVLSGANTYTGGTVVSAGTLRAGATNVFGTGLMTVNGGATLDLAGQNNVVRGLSGAGNVLLGSATLTINGNGSFSGVISGNGGNGGVAIGNGIFEISNQTFSGCGNTYVGPTRINSGSTLTVGCLADGGAVSDIGASSSDSSNLVFVNGTLIYTGGDVITNRGFSMPGAVGANIGVQNSGTTLTFTGQVTGASGSVNKLGAGALVLTGANTYGGGTTVTAGTLRAGSTSAFGTGTMTVSAGTTLDLANRSNTVYGLRGSGAVTLGSATLTFSNGDTGGFDAVFGGTISGSGGLVKNGTGTQTQTLSGLSSYTGPTVINGGVLAVTNLANGGSNSAIGSSGPAAANLVLNGGTLRYVGGTGSTDRQFTLGASPSSKIEASGSGTLAFTNTGSIAFSSPGTAQTIRLGGTNTGNNSFALQITNNTAGATSFTKEDTGTWILSNPNSTYTGVTTINGGVLGVDKLSNGGVASSIGQSSNLASNLVIGNNSTLRYTGAGDSTDRLFTLSDGVTLIESAGTGAIAFTNTGVAGGGGTRSFALGGSNTGANIMAVSITDGTSGTTTLAKNDAGTWYLTGTSTYSGPTNINAGTLFIGNGGTTGSITSSTVNVTGLGALGFNRSDTMTYAGVIQGSGGVTQAGAGTTVLTAANTYTGGTTLADGTLQLGNGGTTGSIAGNVATSGDGVLAFNRSNALTFSGLISGTGSVRQAGTGTTTLTGINTYSGGTAIDRGVLSISQDANLGNVAGGLSFNGGTLTTTAHITSNRAVTLDGAGTVDTIFQLILGGPITGPGSLTKAGTGSLVLTGDATHTGGTTVSGGSLSIGNGGTTGSITGDIVNNAVLYFNRSDDVSYGGHITGTGGVGKRGDNVLSFTADSTIGGEFVILSGVGRVASGNTVGAGSVSVGSADDGVLEVANGSTVRASGAIFLGTGIFGTGELTVTGPGSLIEAGAALNVGTGPSNRGTLAVTNGGVVRSATATLGNTASITPPSSALVSGAGSRWEVAGDLVLNKGILTIADGGTVDAGGTLSLANTAAVTSVLNIGGDEGQTAAAAGMLDASALAFGPGTGRINFNHTDTNYAFATVISGTGAINQVSGVTNLSGNSAAFTGAATVSGGTLLVNGALGDATSIVSVQTGGILGGSGTIGGNVTVADGVLAAGGSPGALTINGNLTLGAATQLNFEFGQANVPGGTLNDIVNIGGDLVLGGTLNVTQTPGGSFGPGVYRMFNYAGALTDNGLTIGSLPGGTGFVQTAIANQVNLVNTAGLELGFWDGPAGPKNDGTIQGGSGSWVLGGGQNNWTEVNGLVNADYSQDSFAVFQGTGGTITVDNSGGNVSASGMQFTADGYTIAGGPLALSGTEAFVRVGDGGAGDAGLTATVGASLTGATQLVKDFAGTLVLTGTNTYTGGTAINGGTLRISGDANLGDATGSLSFNGGTLNTTANITTTRSVNLVGAGTLDVNTGTMLTLSGALSGAGLLAKEGDGFLILAGNSAHTGGTRVDAGILQVGFSTIGSLSGDVLNNAQLAFARSDDVVFDGTISGTGSLSQIGGGLLTLTADSSYTGVSNVIAGTLQLGSGGTTGSIAGDVSNDGALIFNRSNQYSFAGTIFGTGDVRQEGTGTTILAADNSYTGATSVEAGTLLVNGDQSLATGLTSVASGATLGGTGTIGGDVTLAGGAILAPGQGGPGTLTINGNLSLAGTTTLAYEFGQSNVVGGPLNDLTEVAGDLALDGTIDVTLAPGGNFGPGLYRVISYGGALNDQGLVTGAMPAGSTVAVQTSIGGQVNLVNAAGGTFNFWDGADPSNESNGFVDGGNGTWQNSSGNNDWTMTDGAVSGAYTDGTFAIFAAAAGTVDIDNSLGAVSASGLQFASDGYTITGQDLTLVGPQSTIRVGDGTALGLGYTATIDAALIGSSQLVKADLGTLVLSGTNAYTGGTQIDAGTLRISSDANLGDAAGALVFNGGILNTTADITSARDVTMIGNGTFVTDAGTSLVFTGALTGTGNLIKDGAGILALNDTASHTGTTTVRAGSLFINGDLSLATGLTSVASGSTLGGSGIIGGDVTVADGATLAPGNSPGTLTINGGLALSSGSVLDFEFGEANVAGGARNDLVNVGGDLVLDGTINVSVSSGGSFGPGIYRVFNYGGTLTDNDLVLGTMPGGSAVSVQTAVAGQVNLVNTAGLTLSFWDGNAGPKNDGTINGGNGIWRVAGGTNNWTDATGSLNADYAPDSFAIFSGAPGIVTIDDVGGDVEASGLQFASDGYRVTGDALTLTGSQAIIQVGDSSAASAAFTAVIGSELTGSAGLVKTDAGTLVLTGANSYTGGTTIDRGTLQLGNGGTTGSILGDIDNNGVLVLDRSNAIALDGTISGTGSLTMRGGGVLTLTGANSYAGGTTVSGSTVQISSDANLGDAAGRLSLQGGTLQAGASFTSARDILVGSLTANRIDTQGFDVTLTGTIGNGANNQASNVLDKTGAGTLTLTGDNIYANRTVISGGTLALAGAGRAGVGDITVGAGTVFDISQTNTGARVIQLGSGPAGTIALGSKMLTLGLENSFSDWSGTITDGGIAGGTGGSVVIAGVGGAVRYFEANSYTGGTTLLSGRFELVGNGSLYSGGAVTVHGGVFDIAGIAGTGTTIGDLSGAGGGAGAIALGGKSLTFGTANSTSFTGTISGIGGALVKNGAGTFTMSGANSYTGATTVNAGTLLVNGNQTAATGLTSVASGATLGGTGTIGGDVFVADGATLAPGAGGAGALTINGDLSLGSGSSLAFEFGRANAPGDLLNDVVNIGGDLTLDGTINVAVTSGGAFDIGLYRIANYAGTLTDNGLALGTLPAGADVFVQTAVANQVNLINVGGATLNFWDGAADPRFNGAVNGGDGVWQSGNGNDNWADVTGAVNAGYDDGAFAIFTGAAGTVTIDNSVGAVTSSGLQFAADGYTIVGDALTLSGPQSVVRVGDGTAGGAAYTATIESELTGATQLVKTDAGMLVLTGANSYTGGTAIHGGTIRIASDANLGDIAGGLSLNGGSLGTSADMTSARAVELAGAGTFLTDAATALTLTGTVTGAGSLTKIGAGTLVLTGTGSYAGATNVGAGTLLVNGDYAGATGATTVASGANLGGTGTIGGDVMLADGATLTPGAGGAGTLTVAGDLSLAAGATLAYEFGEAGIVGGSLNDLVNVGGDLTLDGTINVTAPTGGAFDVGVYRVFNYGGTLTNNGLVVGTLPGGTSATVQTSIAGQVNLVNAGGLTLGFWDGAAGPKNNGVINGGSGTWQNSTGNDNWADASGNVNAAFSDGAFAVFGGTGGTVTVDNGLGQVTVAGVQFAANGYTITGDAVALTGPLSTVRVGDGSTAGAGFTATINAALTGDTQLVKTDAGTLVLGGINSYTGGTSIQGGTVQISADANLGALAGGLTLDGGTLATSADLTSNRMVTLAGAGTISTADATTFTLGGTLSGLGALTKAGAGTLLLTGDSSGYTGATTVSAGTLAVSGALGGAVTVNSGGRLEGSGSVGSIANTGTVAPGVGGFGTLRVIGSYAGSGGTLEIETALAGDTSQTDRLVVAGGTSGTTALTIINRGGLGAQTVEGIKIVDVTGGTSAGTFTLNGDYVFDGDQALIAGAYGYRLYKNGVSAPTDGDWYLRSSLLDAPAPNTPNPPLFQPGVPIYEAYGQTLMTLTDLGTLQQRIGNRQWAQTESGESSGIWGRMQASRSRPNAVRTTSLSDVNVDSWKFELGADHVLSERSDGASLVLGVIGGYGEANANIASIYGSGSVKAKTYSAGATLSWFGPQGFYVDGRAQVSWFDSKLKSAVLGTLADGNGGTGQAYSVELGKRTPVGQTLSITPQIQMSYQTVGFDRFIDPYGAEISSRLGDSLKTRWGLSVDRQDARSHLYSVVNLSYEWLDGMISDVSGTPVARENHRLWGEVGLGGSVLLADRLTLYTEVSGNTALNDFGESYSLKGTAGLRLAF